jgi:metal-responsive CopG/Arc/MetJ family transcriptional regulator
MHMSMKRVTITAPETLHDRLDRKAKELRRSRSSLFCEAAEKYLAATTEPPQANNKKKAGTR